MLPDYADIVSRLGKPLWYDDHGVPRYDDFHPSMLGVYNDLAVLMEIECQACGELSLVGRGVNRSMEKIYGRTPHLPTNEGAGLWHYGDPPPHGDGRCLAGLTMNSAPRRVVEAWERVGFEWERSPDHEVAWEGDDGWGFADAMEDE